MPSRSFVQRLHVANFKAFEDFRCTLGPTAVLVGPNNAGKSTLLSALRSASRMVDAAKKRSAQRGVRDGNRSALAHNLVADRFGLVDENLRFDFREVETRIGLQFAGKASVTAVWPSEYDESNEGPFFYLHVDGRPHIRTPRAAQEHFPTVATIPMLSPVEQVERGLTDTYVKANADGRLASRHFRNHLWLLQQKENSQGRTDYDKYVDFVHDWTPEIALTGLRPAPGDKGPELDLFYRERGARSEREVFWSGDGMQVWLQLLLHIFRNMDADAIVLDEPDVYLHADLQRRLVRVLETLECQVITASHSPEIVSELDPDAVVWVDKSRKRAVRAPKPEQMEAVSAGLGSGFNLRLARALRSTAVVFVEGQDMRLLRSLAQTLGASRLAAEAGVAIVPLGGFSNWEHVEPFSWMTREFLNESVSLFVILDRDFRSEAAGRDVVDRLATAGAKGHVWSAKELENYLVVPTAFARLSGASVSDINRALRAVTEDMRFAVFSRLHFEMQRSSPKHTHDVSLTEAFQKEFENRWSSTEYRLKVCPGKELLSSLNRRLQAANFKSVSTRALARNLRVGEIAPEMTTVIRGIEETLAGSQ